jgi:hypothetical protein
MAGTACNGTESEQKRARVPKHDGFVPIRVNFGGNLRHVHQTGVLRRISKNSHTEKRQTPRPHLAGGVTNAEARCPFGAARWQLMGADVSDGTTHVNRPSAKHRQFGYSETAVIGGKLKVDAITEAEYVWTSLLFLLFSTIPTELSRRPKVNACRLIPHLSHCLLFYLLSFSSFFRLLFFFIFTHPCSFHATYPTVAHIQSCRNLLRCGCAVVQLNMPFLRARLLPPPSNPHPLPQQHPQHQQHPQQVIVR